MALRKEQADERDDANENDQSNNDDCNPLEHRNPSRPPSRIAYAASPRSRTARARQHFKA
jgi:hypothetical protein